MAARVIPALGVLAMATASVVSILPSSRTHRLPPAPEPAPVMAAPAPTETKVTTVVVAPPSLPPAHPPVTVTQRVPERSTEQAPAPSSSPAIPDWAVFHVKHDLDDQTRMVRTPEELEQFLTAATEQATWYEAPTYAEISSPYVHHNLAIGIGQDGYSVLGWYNDEYSEISASEGTIPTPEDAGFYYRGTWMYAPRNSAIPIEDARHAAREFITTGQRPAGVQWQPIQY